MPDQDKHKREPGPMPYERAAHLLNPLRRLILSPPKLVKRLALQENSKVLELGPGPGYFSSEIAGSIPAGLLVLVDIQQEMLALAQKRLQEKAVANVQYLQGDAVALPVASGCFDVVLLASVLGEVPDKAACLREIYRVLRPQGLLSVTEQLGDPDYIPSSAIRGLIEPAGFRYEKQYSDGWNYTANFRKDLGKVLV
jgi:ubiquinone/menaquinone biosynthesis C-methylase UbiE